MEKEKISFSAILRELRIHCLLFLEYRQKGDTEKVQIQLRSIKRLGLRIEELANSKYVATLYEKIDLLSDDEKADEVADQIILTTLNLEKAILGANLYKLTSETTQKLLTQRRVYD